MATTTVAPPKTNLLGLTRTQLEAFFCHLGEQKFRAQQVLKWLYHHGVGCFDDMTTLSRSLRERLKQVADIIGPTVVSSHMSDDGTAKWLVQVASGSRVETVYIPDGQRGTLCLSSQAGCALDCRFCATGKQGFHANLTAADIIGQVRLAAKHLGNVPAKTDRAITNVVMMGMGEPLLNLDNVVAAMNLMMDDLGYGLSKRRVTLSTAGVVPALQQLGQMTDVSLAISLHAPNDALRDQLVPINRKYPLATLLAAVADYMNCLADRRRVVTIEYVLLAGVNDQPEHLKQLIALLKQTPCKINLIPFNPFPNAPYQRPSNNAIHRFQAGLRQAGFNTTLRKTRGDDITAACGQLVGQVQDKTRRRERYIARQPLATCA